MEKDDLPHPRSDVEGPLESPDVVDSALLQSEAETDTEKAKRRFNLPQKRWLARVACGAAGAVAGAGIALAVSPYNATIAGLPTEFSSTVLKQPGLSVDSSFGHVAFPHITGVPVGFHASPELEPAVADRASQNIDAYGDEVKSSFEDQFGGIKSHFAKVALVGGALGSVGGMGIMEGGWQIVSKRRRRENGQNDSSTWEIIGKGAVATATSMAVATTFLGAWGAATYNSDWQRYSKVDSKWKDLADDFPSDIQKLSQMEGITASRMQFVFGMQRLLNQKNDEKYLPPTAVDIFGISDQHERDSLPAILNQIAAAKSDNVIVVDTGDIVNFSQMGEFELTPSFGADLVKITHYKPKHVVYVFVRGNHDPAGVGKWITQHGGVYLDNQIINAFGLTIAGSSDPRMYADDSPISGPPEHAQQRQYIDKVLKTMNPKNKIDIYAVHEPPAAQEVAKVLGKRVRQIMYGHVHVFNKAEDIQKDGQPIMLQNGTTGLGGIFDISTNQVDKASFEHETVDSTCLFTKLERDQSDDPLIPNPLTSPYGTNTTEEDIYLKPQTVDQGRVCGDDKPVDPAVSWDNLIFPPTNTTTVEAGGQLKPPAATKPPVPVG